jgi:hypothetical protein
MIDLIGPPEPQIIVAAMRNPKRCFAAADAVKLRPEDFEDHGLAEAWRVLRRLRVVGGLQLRNGLLAQKIIPQQLTHILSTISDYVAIVHEEWSELYACEIVDRASRRRATLLAGKWLYAHNKFILALSRMRVAVQDLLIDAAKQYRRTGSPLSQPNHRECVMIADEIIFRCLSEGTIR